MNPQVKKNSTLFVSFASSVIALLFVFVFLGCRGKSGVNTQPGLTPAIEPLFAPVKKIPYNMVVSTDLVRELAFRFASSRCTPAVVLIKAGVNPLLYKPTPEDEKAIMQADIFLYVGLGLEPGLEPIIEKAKGKVRCAAITSNLDEKLFLKSKEYPSGYDPHVWWGPDVWEKILLNVTKILSAIDPEFEFDYGSTYMRYGESTSLLNHRWMETWSAALQKERRVLITIHPAFNYFGRLYDYTTKSIMNPFDSDYDSKRIDELADYIVSNKVPAIFPEYGFSHKPIEDLKAAVEKRGYKVKVAEELYSYSLAQDMKALDYTYLNAGRNLMRRVYDALKSKDGMEMPK